MVRMAFSPRDIWGTPSSQPIYHVSELKEVICLTEDSIRIYGDAPRIRRPTPMGVARGPRPGLWELSNLFKDILARVSYLEVAW